MVFTSRPLVLMEGDDDKQDEGQAREASVIGDGERSVCGVWLEKMGWGIMILK